MFSCQVPVAVLTDCDGSHLLVATDVHTAGLVLVTADFTCQERPGMSNAKPLATMGLNSGELLMPQNRDRAIDRSPASVRP